MDWGLIRRIFEAASGIPADQRAVFVHTESGGDAEIEAKVMHMLSVLENAPGFLRDPVGRVNDQPADSTPPPLLSAGDLVNGRYAIVEQIGSGGSSFVYLASDRLLADRRVVVKVLSPGTDAAWVQHRFEREIAALAKVDHPGVVSVLDRGATASGNPCVVLQYVSGKSLRAMLTEKPAPWPVARVVPLVDQMARALAALHREGICHRDIRPENVIVRNAGERQEQAVLIDFGIATMPKANSATTRVTGTPEYMAPEQLLGRPVPASDVYALGAVTFELLTGRCWHTCVSLKRMDEVDPFYPSEVPVSIRSAVARAIRSDHSARWENAAAFGDALYEQHSAQGGMEETKLWSVAPVSPRVPGKSKEDGAPAPARPAVAIASKGDERVDPLPPGGMPAGEFTRVFEQISPSNSEIPAAEPGEFTRLFDDRTPPVREEQRTVDAREQAPLEVAAPVSQTADSAPSRSAPRRPDRRSTTRTEYMAPTAAQPISETAAPSRENDQKQCGEFTREFGITPADAPLPQGGEQDLPWIKSTKPASASMESKASAVPALNTDETLFRDVPPLAESPARGGRTGIYSEQEAMRTARTPGDYTRMTTVPESKAPLTPAAAPPASAAFVPNHQKTIGIVLLVILIAIAIGIVLWVVL